jgi:imidazolonepropionase-like amidohydrolase
MPPSCGGYLAELATTASTARARRAPEGEARRLSAILLLLVPAVGFAAQEPPAETQPAAPVLVLRASRVLTMEGEGLGALEPGAVRIEGAKIAAVGADVEVPDGAEIFDLPGATILPGLIDARAALPLDPPSLQEARSPSPTFDPLDAVDPFAVEAIEEAIRSGVTSVHLAAARPATLGGRTAVWKLKPRAAVKDGVVSRPAGLHASIGPARARPSSPLGRVGEYRSLEEQFRAALKYREAWKDYESALEEYEREKAKRKEEEKKGKEGKGPEGEGAKKAEAEKKEGEEKGEGKKEEKKDEAPKKPKKPERDPGKEILLEVLDGKYPLRLETHRAEDLLNALLLAESFGFDLVLEGATEASRVAGALADAGVPVVLGPPDSAAGPFTVAGERAPGTAATLVAAGVRVAVASSGADPSESRFLPLVAAEAVGEGLDPAAALRAITIEAARACGVENRLGSLAPGKDADLVVLDGDPLRPETRALAVIVDGEVAYRR